jgi:RimJ/RimL family protein N-acetyltransferase
MCDTWRPLPTRCRSPHSTGRKDNRTSPNHRPLAGQLPPVVSGLARKQKSDGEHPDTGYMRIILKAPRLTLRQFTEDDVNNLFGLNSDPEVMRYLAGDRPTPGEELRDEIIPFHLAVYERLDRLGTWAAESTATGEFLGWFHFRPGRSSSGPP